MLRVGILKCPFSNSELTLNQASQSSRECWGQNKVPHTPRGVAAAEGPGWGAGGMSPGAAGLFTRGLGGGVGAWSGRDSLCGDPETWEAGGL